MPIADEVRQFCADRLHVPIESVRLESDLVEGFDWSVSDYGELSGEFLEDFVAGFSIRTPNGSFTKYWADNQFGLWMVPYYYVKFILFDKKPVEVGQLTVSDLIQIAEEGEWL